MKQMLLKTLPTLWAHWNCPIQEIYTSLCRDTQEHDAELDGELLQMNLPGSKSSLYRCGWPMN